MPPPAPSSSSSSVRSLSQRAQVEPVRGTRGTEVMSIEYERCRNGTIKHSVFNDDAGIRYKISCTVTNKTGFTDITPDIFTKCCDFLQLACNTGAFGLERGGTRRSLHAQGWFEVGVVFAGDPAKIVVKIREAFRKLLAIVGCKISCKIFDRTQTPDLMTGYVQKDEGRRSWYQFDSVGLTPDFCTVALANYRRKAANVLKDTTKIQINKKSFWPVLINLSSKEYFPLKMSGAQLALYAIQSGEYGPCYSWISSISSQGIPVEKAVSFWRCWTAHSEVRKQDIYHVLFDTRPNCGCQEWDLADAAYDDTTASQVQSFAS
ncbi:unnamed protein product [Ectocarpus sp. 12 AP-2014]